MSRKYDLNDSSVVVVIGSGAAGGVLANELAQQGIDVVCLEAGKRLAMTDIENDEAAMFRKMTWLDPREGRGDIDPRLPAFVCKTVGGSTMHWTALSLRANADELNPLSTYGRIPGTSMINWPIGYEELEPWYTKAELAMGVAGTHGMPLHPPSNNFLVLKAGAEKLGYKNITTGRLAINSVGRDGRAKCLQLGFCKSGCIVGAKWSTLYVEIPRAEVTGHFELRPESMALRIEHDRSGKAAGVIYADSDGALHKQKARVVCVAGNAIETPRLLLNSASGLYTDGMGNGSGHVGRHYLKHVFVRVFAEMPGEVNMHRGIQLIGSLEHEMQHDPRRGFASGYHIETTPATPETLAKMLNPAGWGRDYASLLEKYPYFAGAMICGEDLSCADNRITLHDSRRDSYGLPIPVVHYADHENNKAMRTHGVETITAMYKAVGAKRVFTVPAASATHNMGTCRMADDEAEGVCDRWGRVHGIPNLFISDGSQFSSATTANPTLTIVALALRQSAHIRDQLAGRHL